MKVSQYARYIFEPVDTNWSVVHEDGDMKVKFTYLGPPLYPLFYFILRPIPLPFSFFFSPSSLLLLPSPLLLFLSPNTLTHHMEVCWALM